MTIPLHLCSNASTNPLVVSTVFQASKDILFTAAFALDFWDSRVLPSASQLGSLVLACSAQLSLPLRIYRGILLISEKLVLVVIKVFCSLASRLHGLQCRNNKKEVKYDSVEVVTSSQHWRLGDSCSNKGTTPVCWQRSFTAPRYSSIGIHLAIVP